MLSINEIFPAIQGEGTLTGTPQVFIRLSGCNFLCSYCFGVLPGRRIPRIITSEGTNKKIFDVNVGDRLLTFDESNQMVETEVTNVYNRKVDEWYRIRINGKLYFVTPEHPFFTTRGLVKTEDLQIGDMVLHATFKDKLSFKMLNDKNPMKNSDVSKKRRDNTDYVSAGRKHSDTIRKQKEKGIYISTWDKLTNEKKEELRKMRSDRMTGNKNLNYIGDRDNCNELHRQIKKQLITECAWCGEKNKSLYVHHKDGNSKNDSKDNLVVICSLCHNKHHKRGYNFWLNERSDDKTIKNKHTLEIIKARNGLEVEEIKYFNRNHYTNRPYWKPKPLEVYNISCEPYNSYLVDYMWVHNCDTSHSWTDIGREMSVQEVIEEVEKYGFDSVCITGGEPTLQKDSATLCRELQKYGYFVSVQTNGGLWTSLLEIADKVCMDMKKPFINIDGKLKYSNLSYISSLDCNDEVKVLVGGREDLDYAHLVNDIASKRVVTTIFQIENNVYQDTREDLIEKYKDLASIIIDDNFKYPYKILPQLHVLIWGNERRR